MSYISLLVFRKLLPEEGWTGKSEWATITTTEG